MFRKKGKKGFTLVEMLVVIAVIAILVSMIMPMFSRANVKSAAAANAANLRAVKGQLSTMRVMYPGDFKTMMSEQGVVGSAITGFWSGILDAWYGEGVGDQTITGLMCSFTANDGVLTLYAPNIVIDNVPVSKKMKLEGSNKSNSITLEEGIQMSVLITESDIIPSYGGYTIEQFADIAEDGKLDEHTISAPAGGGGVAGALCKLRGYHKDGNGDEVCDDCEYAMGYHDCKDTNNDHICDVSDNCLATVSACLDEDSNHMCDICGDKLTSCSYTYSASGHSCTICGASSSHSKSLLSSNCSTSGCPYSFKANPCGCKLSTSWPIYYCSTCKHSHNGTCEKDGTTGTWVSG